MLHFPRWQIVLVMLLVVSGLIAAAPNLLSKETVESWPNWLPKQQLLLGLDLQGGAYLLYQVDADDYIEKRLRALTSDVRRAMLENPRIGYTGLGIQGQSVQLRVRDLDRLDDVRTRLDPLRNALDTGLLTTGTIFEFDLSVADDGLTRFTYSPTGLSQRIRGIVQQSIEVIDRRINELGTTEPSIQRQGDDRILVEAPGLGDPQRLKALVGQTAQLRFHLVENIISAEQAGAEAPTPGTIQVPDINNVSQVYVVDEAPLMTGEDLVDAQTAFDQITNEPVVNFRLNTAGARKFAEVTQANVGRPFAIILDDEVISAPVIREPIIGGSGQISGSFSVQSANDLAILLRAGSLPARLIIVEERVVGPGLGADSVEAGKIAAGVGFVAIAILMIATYGFFGVIANIAVLVNVVLIFGILTLLGAALTLPGIAGIVLTVGMAVDSNVLIYERIREEFKQGRSAISAIDVGFKRALGTILDANITTMIAALVMFQLGSGPIRGFAITQAIGIVTTVFTAFMFTRMIIAFWVSRRRPTTIAI